MAAAGCERFVFAGYQSEMCHSRRSHARSWSSRSPQPQTDTAPARAHGSLSTGSVTAWCSLWLSLSRSAVKPAEDSTVQSPPNLHLLQAADHPRPQGSQHRGAHTQDPAVLGVHNQILLSTPTPSISILYPYITQGHCLDLTRRSFTFYLKMNANVLTNTIWQIHFATNVCIHIFRTQNFLTTRIRMVLQIQYVCSQH